MSKYDVNNGVKKIKVKLAIAVSTVMAFSGLGFAVAIPAISHAAYCDASSNGCAAAATAGAQCGTGAGSGAFGAFGAKGDVAHDFRGGADGQQTGLNNSALCGNRQGNL
jgi:hypothetical protein